MQLATSAVEPEPSGPPSALQIASGELNATPATPLPLLALPVIVPATCVPWPLSSAHVPSWIEPLEDAADAARLRAVGDLAGQVLVRGEDAGVDDADLHAAGRREGAEPGGVPALGRVDVGVRRAAGLARVVEPVELARSAGRSGSRSRAGLLASAYCTSARRLSAAAASAGSPATRATSAPRPWIVADDARARAEGRSLLSRGGARA